MDPNMIRDRYSSTCEWKDILQPYLQEVYLQFEKILLLKEIERNKIYIAFILVSRIDPSKASGLWFSDWVKVTVHFDDDVYLQMGPVHFRKEIQQFEKGVTLVDNRDNLQIRLDSL